MVLLPPLHEGRPLGFAPEAALEDLGLPPEGHAGWWCSCLGRRYSGTTRYSGELAARAAGNTVLQKGMATSTGQYAPVFLPGEPPPWQRSLAGHSLQGHKEADTAEATLRAQMQVFSARGSSAPVRAECEGGAAAWLLGTLAVPSVQGHPLMQELRPYQSFLTCTW